MSETAQFRAEDVMPQHKSGFVAVVGKPNVGKSTLVNQLVGYKVAIVSPKPQTTRSRILGILTREDVQVIFIDTPGIHQPRHELGKVMVAAATRAIPDSDVVLLVVDVSTPPDVEEKRIAKLIQQRTDSPVLLVLNKMDLLAPDRVKLHTEAYWELVPKHQSWMMTTATTGVNLDKLLSLVVEILPAGPEYYPGDQVTDQTERQVAAELVREQVLRHTRQEVPHAVAVVVTEFKERRGGAVYIAADVIVERDSQKGIIIGKRGSMLRKIGTASRREIERMVSGTVYLDLTVKVRKDWRSRPRDLQYLGFDRQG